MAHVADITIQHIPSRPYVCINFTVRTSSSVKFCNAISHRILRIRAAASASKIGENILFLPIYAYTDRDTFEPHASDVVEVLK